MFFFCLVLLLPCFLLLCCLVTLFFCYFVTLSPCSLVTFLPCSLFLVLVCSLILLLSSYFFPLLPCCLVLFLPFSLVSFLSYHRIKKLENEVCVFFNFFSASTCSSNSRTRQRTRTVPSFWRREASVTDRPKVSTLTKCSKNCWGTRKQAEKVTREKCQRRD